MTVADKTCTTDREEDARLSRLAREFWASGGGASGRGSRKMDEDGTSTPPTPANTPSTISIELGSKSVYLIADMFPLSQNTRNQKQTS